jgi:hypothetical protein
VSTPASSRVVAYREATRATTERQGSCRSSFPLTAITMSFRPSPPPPSLPPPALSATAASPHYARDAGAKTEMVVPPSNHRSSDLRRTCTARRKVPRDELGQGRPEDARRPAGQNRAALEAGGSMRQAHPKPLPSFADREALRILYAPPIQRKPHSILSMPRLCAFAEQTPLPQPTPVAAGGSCIMRVSDPNREGQNREQARCQRRSRLSPDQRNRMSPEQRLTVYGIWACELPRLVSSAA